MGALEAWDSYGVRGLCPRRRCHRWDGGHGHTTPSTGNVLLVCEVLGCRACRLTPAACVGLQRVLCIFLSALKGGVPRSDWITMSNFGSGSALRVTY